jgi:hypothetical protein
VKIEITYNWGNASWTARTLDGDTFSRSESTSNESAIEAVTSLMKFVEESTVQKLYRMEEE